jgi:hypothetical protein
MIMFQKSNLSHFQITFTDKHFDKSIKLSTSIRKDKIERHYSTQVGIW